jgi:hypothetical protein
MNGWSFYIMAIGKKINIPFDVWVNILGFDKNILIAFFIHKRKVIDKVMNISSFFKKIPEIVHLTENMHYVRLSIGTLKSYKISYKTEIEGVRPSEHNIIFNEDCKCCPQRLASNFHKNPSKCPTIVNKYCFE